MKSYDLFESLSWANAYAGVSVVYALSWDGKDYVGSSTNLSSRLSWWRNSFKPSSVAVRVRILWKGESDKRLEREEFYIKKLRTHTDGHNRTRNGRGGTPLGYACTEEAKAKISAANTGKRRSAETKQKMRDAKLGKPQKPEHVAARAASNTGRKRSAQACANISASVKGVPKSDAHRQALKAAWVLRRARQNQP